MYNYCQKYSSVHTEAGTVGGEKVVMELGNSASRRINTDCGCYTNIVLVRAVSFFLNKTLDIRYGRHTHKQKMIIKK